MKRLALLLSATFLLSGPAWAGCANYIDGSLSVPPPRVEICYAGECEETVLESICSNVNFGIAIYANGLVAGYEGDEWFVSFNGADISFDDVSCSIIHEEPETGEACDWLN